MVAVSIFSIVSVIVTGALLTAIAINNKAQAIKLAMDNLNYALDSITIKMKRGRAFEFNASNELHFISPKDDPVNPEKAYTYRLDPSGAITMEVGGDTRFITSDKLHIDEFRAFVSNNVSGSSGAFPRAVIIIRGAARVGNQEQKFAVGTTVTERQ